LDLVPGEGPTARDLLQERGIVGSDPQGERLSATHGAIPGAGVQDGTQHTDRSIFLALLRARDTRNPLSSPQSEARFCPCGCAFTGRKAQSMSGIKESHEFPECKQVVRL